MPEKSPLKPAKSGRTGATLGLALAIPFGLVFICVGCAVLWMMTIRPLAQVAASLRWQPVEAVVLSSELETQNNSKDDNTYRVVIRYRYVWPPADRASETAPPALLGAPSPDSAPREYIGERYDFSKGHTNVAVSDMRAVIDAHPPGARVTCYVDPAAPDSAVIDRSPPLHVWMGFGFGVFLVAGLGIIVAAWFSRRSAIAADKTRLASRNPDARVGELPLALARHRMAEFGAAAFITLFWNGIVSVFVIIAIKEFGEGFMGWFLPVFLIPFVLVGLVLIAGLVCSLSNLFAPAVHTWIEDAPLRLGTTHRLRWRLGGPGVRRLRIRLRVREESTDARGSETINASANLIDELVYDSDDTVALREGDIALTLPRADLAPAFNASHARLVWELVFQGEIPRRTDLEDCFPLPVFGPADDEPVAAETTPVEHAGQGVSLWTPERFAPGDALVFTVARDAAAAPGPLTVRLGWFTEAPGVRDSDIVWSEIVPDLPPGAHRTFETRLPVVPWSFAGAFLALHWRLEVVDRRKRVLVSAPLVVAPRGEIVQLPPPPPAPPEPKSPPRRWFSRAPSRR